MSLIGAKDSELHLGSADVYLPLTRGSLVCNPTSLERGAAMNLSSVIRGLLLILILLGLMTCALPPKAPWGRLGAGWALSGLLIGRSVEHAGPDYVASAF